MAFSCSSVIRRLVKYSSTTFWQPWYTKKLNILQRLHTPQLVRNLSPAWPAARAPSDLTKRSQLITLLTGKVTFPGSKEDKINILQEVRFQPLHNNCMDLKVGFSCSQRTHGMYWNTLATVRTAAAVLSPIVPLNLQEKVKKVSWKRAGTLICLRVDSNNNHLLSKQRRCRIKNTQSLLCLSTQNES